MIVKHGLLGLALVGSLVVLAGPVGADSGWLLLVPPVKATGEFDTTVPLNRWEQIYALDKATECESVKEALRAQQIKILNEREDPPPRPPTPEEVKRHEEEAKESERRCEEDLKRPKPRFGMQERLDWTICEVLKESREEDAKLTAEEKAQRQKEWQKEWEERRAKRRADRRMRQAKAQEELERMEHAKCVPADAVYRVPK